MELCIDTSTRYASVAITVGGSVVKEVSWHSSNNHTLELASTVAAMLEDAGASVADLDNIIVAKGPGGFSALRVGMGFAKGLAESMDMGLVGVSTLELEAARFFDTSQGSPLCPMLEVGLDRFAWSLYEFASAEWSLSMTEQVTTLEAMADAVPGSTLFCGEGAWQALDRLQALGRGKEAVIATTPPAREAAVLSLLGLRALTTGAVADSTAMEPNYLRQPSITMPSTTKPK